MHIINNATKEHEQRILFLEQIRNHTFSHFFLMYSPPAHSIGFDIELASLLKEFDDSIDYTTRLAYAQQLEHQIAFYKESSSVPEWLRHYCQLLAKIPQPHDQQRITQLRHLVQTFDNVLELRFILAFSLAQHGLTTKELSAFKESQAIFTMLEKHCTLSAHDTYAPASQLFMHIKVKTLEYYASCLLLLDYPQEAFAVLDNARNNPLLTTEHTMALHNQVCTLQIMHNSCETFTKRIASLAKQHVKELQTHNSVKNVCLSIFLGISFLFPIMAALITTNSKLSFDQLVRVIIATGLTALVVMGISILLTNTKSKLIILIMLLGILVVLGIIVLGLTPAKTLLLTMASYAYHSIMG